MIDLIIKHHQSNKTYHVIKKIKKKQAEAAEMGMDKHVT